MKRRTVSLCLIARDEEGAIGLAIKSALALVDEVIVVDTGSRDNTRIIAEGYGARIVEFAWRDDFAAARNAALDEAFGDWVLILDADERLEPLRPVDFQRLLANETAAGYRVERVDARTDTVAAFVRCDCSAISPKCASGIRSTSRSRRPWPAGPPNAAWRSSTPRSSSCTRGPPRRGWPTVASATSASCAAPSRSIRPNRTSITSWRAKAWSRSTTRCCRSPASPPRWRRWSAPGRRRWPCRPPSGAVCPTAPT